MKNPKLTSPGPAGLKLPSIGLALLASASLANAQITLNFESETAGSTTPPTGWTYPSSDLAGGGTNSYTVSAAGEGSDGSGGNAGLAADLVAGNSQFGDVLPHSYLLNSGSAPLDLTKPISGSYDFRHSKTNGSAYDSSGFLFGDIGGASFPETDAGQLLLTYHSNGGYGNSPNHIYDGTSSSLTSNSSGHADNTWYRVDFTWTPTGGTTGDFAWTSTRLSNGSTQASMSVDGFSFTKPGANVGFADLWRDRTRFDNISITGTPFVGTYWDTNGTSAGAGDPATGTWDGAATNWNPNEDGTDPVAAWTPGGTAVFAAGTDAVSPYTVTVSGTQDIGGLVFLGGTPTLTGGTLRMTSDTSVAVNGASAVEIASDISDDAGTRVLSTGGNGTLTLSGNNSGASGSMSAGGITQFDAPNSIPGTGENLTVTSTGTVVFGSSFVDTNIPAALDRIVTTSTGTVAADNYATTAFDFDTPGLTDAYLGAVGSVTYSGTLTPESSGATYRLGGGGGTLDISSALTGVGNSAIISGPGTVVLSNVANTYDGSTTIDSDGLLQVGVAGGLSSASALVVEGTLQLDGNDASTSELSGSGTVENGNASTDATLTVDISSNTNFSGTFEDGGSASLGLTKTGSSQLTLTSNNSFTGDLTISGGTFQLGTNGNTGSLNGGSYPGDISIASGSTFRDRSNTTVTMSGVISGDGTLHKDGSGTMTLTGANTYTGKTIIKASGGGGPTLSVSSLNSVTTPAQQASSSLGVPADAAAGTIDLGSGTNVRNCTLIYTGAGEETDRVMNVSFNSGADQEIRNNGSGLLKFTSAFTINRSSGNSGGRFTLGGSADGEVEGGMSGGIIPGDLWKDDAGTWTLGGTTTADDLRVNAGTLVIDVGGTLDATDSDLDGTGAVVVSGGTLTVDGQLDFVSATVSGGALDGSGTLSFDIDGTTFDQVVMTSGSMDISGLAVEVVPGVGGLTEAEYILVDATGGGTLTGTFTGVTGASGYALDYGTPNQVKLVSSGGSPFDTWAGTGTLGPVTFDGDTNGDGVQDGLAFLLGVANPDDDANGSLPDVSESGGDLVMEFDCLATGDRGTAVLNLEYDGDLSAPWLSVPVPGAVGNTTDNTPATGSVDFVATANGSLIHIVATISDATESAGGKLFGRLTATE